MTARELGVMVVSGALWTWTVGTYGVGAVPEPISLATRAFGQRVRTQREALGLSQEALAARSGIHWTFLGQVERGQRNLNLHNLLKVAAGLGIDPGELVRGLQPPDGEPDA